VPCVQPKNNENFRGKTVSGKNFFVLLFEIFCEVLNVAFYGEASFHFKHKETLSLKKKMVYFRSLVIDNVTKLRLSATNMFSFLIGFCTGTYTAFK
jgi:hypothetical protein